MALKVQFSSLSQGASVDQQSGNLSVFDVLDEIRTDQIPIHLPSLILTMIWERSAPTDTTYKLFIHLLPPDGKQVMLGNGDLQFPAEQKRVKAVFRFAGFPVQSAGTHRFVVSWLKTDSQQKEGERIIDLDVIQVAPQNPAPHPGAPGVAH
ncbi:MAG: hypothetical protein EOP09_10705 [Proteobacteria bacterium]|nr:MAG: hypothetical protein EOP09_10705 [Pseudomonadota bacterium]